MIFRKKQEPSEEKIFCLSLQRTGTTSVGGVLKELGYPVANWHTSRKNNWGAEIFNGNYEGVFNSKDFQKHVGFEDGPWWYPDFYKVLFHRFPLSKFILIERDENKWFDSMLSHSKGKTLGNTFRHVSFYRRENELFELNGWSEDAQYNIDDIDNLLEITEGHRKHYTAIYELYNFSIKQFFNKYGSKRLFTAMLEDENKWDQLSEFLGKKPTGTINVHLNKSK